MTRGARSESVKQPSGGFGLEQRPDAALLDIRGVVATKQRFDRRDAAAAAGAGAAGVANLIRGLSAVSDTLPNHAVAYCAAMTDQQDLNSSSFLGVHRARQRILKVIIKINPVF